MYRQLRFPFMRFILLITVSGMISPLFGAKAPFESTGFIPVQGKERIHDGVQQLYLLTFDELATSPDNASDIVLFDGISYLALDEKNNDDETDDSYVYAASYTGYHTDSKTDQDEGRLILEVNEDVANLSAGGVVGFFRKSGAWQTEGGVVDSVMANLNGTVEFETLEKSRDVDIDLSGQYDGQAFSFGGESTLSVLSETSSSISSWSAEEGSEYDFSFSTVVLTREEDSNVYEGVVTRTDSDEDEEDDYVKPLYQWKNRYGLIRLTDETDADGDGVPNFSDTGAEEVLGVLQTNSIALGNGSYWSNDLNTTIKLDPKELWLYGENLGWFYLPDQDDSARVRIYIPDVKIGWIVTNADLSPYYIRESDGAKLYFDIVDGEVWYYDYSVEGWFQPAY